MPRFSDFFFFMDRVVKGVTYCNIHYLKLGFLFSIVHLEFCKHRLGFLEERLKMFFFFLAYLYPLRYAGTRLVLEGVGATSWASSFIRQHLPRDCRSCYFSTFCVETRAFCVLRQVSLQVVGLLFVLY